MNPALAQKRWSSPKILRSDQYKFRLTASDFLGGGEKLISLLVIPKYIEPGGGVLVLLHSDIILR